MLSMSIHSGINGTLTCPSTFPTQNPIIKAGPFKASCSLLKHNPSPHKFPTISYHQITGPPIDGNGRLRASATAEAEPAAVEIPTDEGSSIIVPDQDSQNVNVERPKLVLKFIWMEKNIGLGLDQEIAGHGRVPLSPYFFWPRKDAWEELKTTLESKPWITQKMMIILLNQATDIINLWQQSGGNLT